MMLVSQIKIHRMIRFMAIEFSTALSINKSNYERIPELPNCGMFLLYLTICTCTVVRFWTDGNFRYLFLNYKTVMPVQ